MVIYAFLLRFFSPSVKKSDKDMNDKRLTKSYESHNKPQSSHYLVVHEYVHLSYRRYKVKQPCFFGHLKVHKYQYSQTHIIFVFVFFFFLKIFPFYLLKEKKNYTKKKNIVKSNKD